MTRDSLDDARSDDCGKKTFEAFAQRIAEWPDHDCRGRPMPIGSLGLEFVIPPSQAWRPRSKFVGTVFVGLAHTLAVLLAE